MVCNLRNLVFRLNLPWRGIMCAQRTFRKSGVFFVVTALATILQWAGGVRPVQADILGLWQLDETSGTVAPNSVPRGTEGVLVNGPVWTTDSERGQVLVFDGSNDYVEAGAIPALSRYEDFTWTFWARSEQPPDSRVVLGNRFGVAGDNAWIKFTPSKFEYKGPSHFNVDYTDMSQNVWIHHAVVKEGSTLTYYRDGVQQGASVSAPTDIVASLPFFFGGDAAGERWKGRIDDVAIFNDPLEQEQIQAIMGGDFSQFDTSQPTKLLDYFSATTVDTFKWDVVNRGLESTADGGYDAPVVSSGTLTLGGETTVSDWAGKTLASKDTFQAPSQGEIRFDVDRVSLAGTGEAYRSSITLFDDDSHFVQFSQSIGTGEHGWQYNAGNNTPTGSGVNLALADIVDANQGNVKMSLVHDGSYVKMFVGGRYVGAQAADFTEFRTMLTGQAKQASDSVTAVYDNVNVSTRTYPDLYDDFNSGVIDPAKWTILNKGLQLQGAFPGDLTATVKDGELVFGNPAGDGPGSTETQHWNGVTLRTASTIDARNMGTFTVDRDALVRGGTTVTADRSGIWIWADDNHFLFFGQNWGENGWQYNYADGVRTDLSVGGGVNISAFNSLDADGGQHEIKAVFRPNAGGVNIDMYLNDVLGASQRFDNWGGLDYYYMISGMPRASTDAVYAAFDNVQILLPEPGSWMLLLLGAVWLMAGKRRRRHMCP